MGSPRQWHSELRATPLREVADHASHGSRQEHDPELVSTKGPQHTDTNQAARQRSNPQTVDRIMWRPPSAIARSAVHMQTLRRLGPAD